MDAQLKRGFLEACVLATIRQEPSYGYLILRSVPEVLELTESTLYPLLRRLEEAGSLTVESVEHNGRLRKYYHITKQGRAKLEEFADDWDQVKSVYEYIRSKMAVPITVIKEDQGHEQVRVS